MQNLIYVFTSFCSPSKNRRKSIKSVIVNCNGLKSASKKSQFQALIDQHRPDIVLGCESKLGNSISTHSVFPSDFNVFRKDRDEHGGGVFVAVHNSLIVSNCPEFDVDCELLWCSLQFTNAKPLFIASFYRPPNNRKQDLDQLRQSLSKLMTQHRRSHPNIIIGGDFNLPDINWESGTTTNPCTSNHQELLDLLLENSLSQVIREVTRPASSNILDLLITSNPALVSDVNVLPGISDHDIISFTFSGNLKFAPKPSRKIFQFHKANQEGLSEAVRNFSTEFLASSPELSSVDENWIKILNFLNECIKDFIPSKISKNRRHLPWITPELKRHMRKRDRLFKKARRNPSTAAWQSYRQYRNKVAKLVHQAHNNYVNNVVGDSLSDNPKTFWSYVKLCRTENMGIPSLRQDDKLYATAKDKAECLNTYFQSVFTKDETCPDFYQRTSPYNDIGHLYIHRPGVEKQLRELNPSKASGPDEIPPRLLKLVAHEIAPSLAFLFQQSFNTGTVPTQWKHALVTPIHKSGDKCNPSNYRPISLTCICCKIMEHVVLSHISKHLALHNILTDVQHGFRQRLSTTTQLISAIQDWANTLQTRGQTDVVFLDFRKAFDRVSHQRLHMKLRYYGITGDTLHWINSLLSGRQQAVTVSGSQSTWRPVTSGVPQGSVIGPVLFLLYINDINVNVQSKMRLFADDSVIYREIHCIKDHEILQQDLHALADWSRQWLMDFNIRKCATLTITRKRKPSLCEYELLEDLIPRVQEYKYLGIIISKDLRWTAHCQTIRQKANRTLGLLRRTLSPCSKDVKNRAYQALVRPQMEYGSEAWNPYCTTTAQSLEGVQKAAARFVYQDYRWSTSSTALVSKLGWDTLHTRRLAAQSNMFYKIHYKLVNITLPSSISPATYIGRHDHKLKYAIPEATMDPYKFSFYPRTVWVWNHLPYNTVTAPTVDTFQKAALPTIRRLQPPVGSKML